MTERRPGVTLGLPVYNGENFVREALDSVLAQSYEELELVVADNASTDATEEICRDYAARDSRIVYLRNEANIGATANFNRVFHAGRRRYFKWMAHDDRLAPEFVARCVEVLDEDPSTVLAFSKVSIIDESGALLRTGLTDRLTRVWADSPSERFRDLIIASHSCYFIWGVMRADALARTPLMESYIATDRVLLAELGLLGRLRLVPEDLFMLRAHHDRSVTSLPSIYLRGAWHDPAKRGRYVFPHWRIGAEYWRAVGRAELGTAERARCYAALGRWLVSHWNAAKLGMDVVAAFVPRSIETYERARRWDRRRRKRKEQAGERRRSSPG